MIEPKVSVIMGIYNCELTLEKAIQSIIEQTYLNWELIMCDDASTDSTYQIAKKFKDKYPEKIILLQNEYNMKLSATLNRCLQYVSGEYVARMDADDFSCDVRFERQVQYLIENPDVSVVGTGMICFNNSGIIGTRSPESTPGPNCIGPGTPFFHATIMMRTEVYKTLGGYSMKKYATRCEDIDLWMRLFAAGFKGDNITEPLYYVREDFAALKRRKLRDGINVSRMLFNNYKKFHYPKKQFIFVIKPIISCLTPNFLKYFYNKFRWK